MTNTILLLNLLKIRHFIITVLRFSSNIEVWIIRVTLHFLVAIG